MVWLNFIVKWINGVWVNVIVRWVNEVRVNAIVKQVSVYAMDVNSLVIGSQNSRLIVTANCRVLLALIHSGGGLSLIACASFLAAI